MSVKYVKFDPATGRILFAGEVPEDMIELQGENVWLGQASPQFDYMVNGEPAPRPDLAVAIPETIAADGTAELVIPGVPAGASVRVYGPTSMEGVTEEKGDVTLTFALAGTYTLLIECFPYNDLKATIHAV
jgi:hypothetical protein